MNLLKKIKRYPEFYQKVWRECLKIPAGQTSTYGEIARKIGMPKAARAVGSALSKNPFAPTIPCHRVVRKDGKSGGYGAKGGIRKKMRLLKTEAEKAGKV